MANFTLNHEHWRLSLAPEFGGSVLGARLRGRSILRVGQAPERENSEPNPDSPPSDPCEMAGFPLVPFAGRIHKGCFSWQGASYILPANMPPEPHAIHGQGWQSAWRVVDDKKTDACTLSYRHDGEVWPWPYIADQTFSLGKNSLEWRGRVTNLGTTPMPAGLGWHPYFPRAGARIRADVSTVWRSDENMIPKALYPLGGIKGIQQGFEADAVPLDYAFVRGDAGAGKPIAVLTYPDYEVHIFADAVFSSVIIYTPLGQDFFCVEPISHAPDAVNSTLSHDITGLIPLRPQESLQGKIRLEVKT